MKTENQELIDKLDLAIEGLNSAIADLEDVKIDMDRKVGVKKLGRSFLYKTTHKGRINIYNGLIEYPDDPSVISTLPGFICWLDNEWVKIN